MSEIVPDLLQPRLSSKVLIVNQYADLLLLQRAAHDTHRPHQYDLPGGGFEPEDTDAVDCAIRETFQETGLKLRAAELHFLTKHERPSSCGPFVNERYFYVASLAIGRRAVKLDPNEHQSSRWAFCGDAYNLLGHPVQKEIVAYQYSLDHYLDLELIA